MQKIRKKIAHIKKNMYLCTEFLSYLTIMPDIFYRFADVYLRCWPAAQLKYLV